MDIESALSVHNLPFLEELYEQSRRDPGSVPSQWLALLNEVPAAKPSVVSSNGLRPSPAPEKQKIGIQNQVDELIEAYRLHGHLAARIDPLQQPRKVDTRLLDPAYHKLAEEHLGQHFHSSGLIPDRPSTLREILEKLQNTYTRSIGVEYWHLSDPVERAWLQSRMESCENRVIPVIEGQKRLLHTLARIEDIDQFLHAKFIGAKRFSVSGAESAICFLDALIESAADTGIDELILAMAHRGRLTTLMQILGKSPVEVFSEFGNTDPLSYLGSGDVKYHQGFYRDYISAKGSRMYLAMTFNPSHLEAITPVLQGRVRARQDSFPQRGYSASLGVTVHGDAAFAGQGVVMETLNLSELEGYSTGGTIRLIINNQIGFTTDPDDARAGLYCTDVAHLLQVPVFHVNGDDPEASAYVAQLALEWRNRFHRDVIIDLVCYRKYGHNEGDDPTFTQPRMYKTIQDHQSVRSLYQEFLIERGTVDQSYCDRIRADFSEEFAAAFERARSRPPKPAHSPMHGIWSEYVGGDEHESHIVDTRLDAEVFEELKKKLVTLPPGFQAHKKIERFLEESQKMLAGQADLNWATAEMLVYGSLLIRGIPIRFSGQDAQRGTFSHRHAVFTDIETGEKWSPLYSLSESQAKISIHNSPLSEFSVLGFEFGYSLMAPQALVLWEAQFGDFANGAQVIIDQFLSSSEDKWNRLSGLVLLLPHGYEGQGPEHSSARVERFLQLCAQDNMQVCYPSTSSQMFHMLRRQVMRIWRKPLVVMTPKSLLRFRPSFAPIDEFTSGQFRLVIDDSKIEPSQIMRLCLCTGKVFYDLDNERDRLKRQDVAIVRVEQLYPLPAKALRSIIERYPNANDILWVQEEPRNMGAWTFMNEQFAEQDLLKSGRLKFVGRPASASPATGSPEAHKLETQSILQQVFARS